ncbi:D-alanyl-D-alanine carboxypeptidase [Catenulispora sp. GP43]|uniref:D-alanyl-D-alanine carboxypeptidase family protein n=1 Tax=Catenulispora sp. GP43 TaxID=3156263 RepID=UPI003510E7AF
MHTSILRNRVTRWGTAVLLAAVPAATAVPAQARPVSSALPATGQAALWSAGRLTVSGPVAKPQPIASVTKVMTAYRVLADHPLKPGEQGPMITVLASEVSAYHAARRNGESVIPVAAGEQISEHKALEAMLLPSANDMARILARWDAGSIDGFVARMNETAAQVGMDNTHYADPAGVNTATVSTAPDLLRLDQNAMANPVLAGVVGEKSAAVPVAGKVRNSNPLLGTDGFVGTKTGWTSAAGSCLMFAVRQGAGHDRDRLAYGVLLGQPGGPESGTIFMAARRMAAAARAGR